MDACAAILPAGQPCGRSAARDTHIPEAGAAHRDDTHMHTRTIQVGKHTLTIETGRLAKQADGAVGVRVGDTMVLVTAGAAANAREGIDFLPLTVDYREYTYASGRIPGG